MAFPTQHFGFTLLVSIAVIVQDTRTCSSWGEPPLGTLRIVRLTRSPLRADGWNSESLAMGSPCRARRALAGLDAHFLTSLCPLLLFPSSCDLYIPVSCPPSLGLRGGDGQPSAGGAVAS